MNNNKAWFDSPKKKKRKKLKKPSSRECIIHIKDCAEPVSPFTQVSWQVRKS